MVIKMSENIINLINKALGTLRIKIIKKEKINIVAVQKETAIFYSSEYVLFDIPVEKCVYPYFFSYDPLGWHHFVQTLYQYDANDIDTYHGSHLERYYDRFRVREQYDLYFDLPVNDLRRSCPGLGNYPIDRYFPLIPWEIQPSRLLGERGLDCRHGNQGFGPVSQEKKALEFSRLTGTYESIKSHGYDPGKSSDGHIKGYFLINRDDYRFMINEGYHRTASLAALGYKKITATFKQHHVKFIDIKEVSHWPMVKKKLFTAKIAEMIFMKFFEDNGVQRARSIGLL